ncbi:hypothetical protein OG552_20830 [Streptomyces sp. NBC_01476]|uniref:hypothetical protein n=1 Tax=Streptomyces sp. NBC_01476 TaxID=2903881 RepID=UPI002E376F4A|nr:hypothetical protein [Streptomyces sp. NBC_01476]
MTNAAETTTDTAPPVRGEPRPEPIRYFGTSWVAHDRGYGLRRAGVTLGALLSVGAGLLFLAYGFQGLANAVMGVFVTTLAVVGVAVCSVLAFRRTWSGYLHRRPVAEPTSNLYWVGFVGSLLAYLVRSFTEAPGERLRRTEYEAALADHTRRRDARSGNPATARPKTL